MNTKDIESIDISLPFALTTSAYFIQFLSDLYFVDNISISSKLAQIAAMRHYRAGVMLSNQKLRDISLKINIYDLQNKDNIDIENLISTTMENDGKIKNVLSINYNLEKEISEILNNEIDPNDQIGIVRARARAMDRSRDLKLTYYNMIDITNKCTRNLTNLKLEFESEEKNKFYNSSICLQCGEVYDDRDKINDECVFCKSGINHIVSIYEILY